jgi:hypothetical protein
MDNLQDASALSKARQVSQPKLGPAANTDAVTRLVGV